MNKHTATLTNGKTVTRNSKTRVYGYVVEVSVTVEFELRQAEYYLRLAQAGNTYYGTVAECQARLEAMRGKDLAGVAYYGENAWTKDERTGAAAIKAAEKIFGRGNARLIQATVETAEDRAAAKADAAEAKAVAAEVQAIRDAEAPAHEVPASHADSAATMADEIAAVLAGDAQPPTAEDMSKAKAVAAAARLRRDEFAEYAHGAGPDSPEVQEVMEARDAERAAAYDLDRIVILRDAWHARMDRLTVSEKKAELQAARRDAGKPARDRSYAMDHAAIKGETVTQGHADYCAEYGHAVTIVEGQDQGVCPRCGDVTMSATEHAALVAECLKAAEATARCTGSVAATHTIERVLPTTGTRYTVATATWTRP